MTKRWTVDSSKFLSEEQLSVLFKALDNDASKEEHSVVLGLLYTGLRVSEAIRFDVADFQTDRIAVKDSKGGVNRTVLLTDDAVVFFRKIINRRIRGPMFRSARGTAYSKRGMQRAVERVMDRIGLPHIHTHSLRHTYCTLLMKAGESLPMIRDQLGHSSISVTDIYSHSCGKLKIKTLFR